MDIKRWFIMRKELAILLKSEQTEFLSQVIDGKFQPMEIDSIINHCVILSGYTDALKFNFKTKEKANFFIQKVIELFDDSVIRYVEDMTESDETFLYEIATAIEYDDYDEDVLAMMKRILLKKYT